VLKALAVRLKPMVMRECGIVRLPYANYTAGMSQDFWLAEAYAHQRTVRLMDGPDEVHRSDASIKCRHFLHFTNEPPRKSRLNFCKYLNQLK
jgi:hypothetical protein